MCDNLFIFLFAVLGTLQVSEIIEPFSDYKYITLSDRVIDAEVDIAGNIYVLLPGLPHLRVYSSEGPVYEYDLSDILLPGGMCVDERWGWFVTGEITNKIYRYDDSGELTDSRDSRGLPGDICLYGMDILYVSQASGTVSSLYEPDDILLRLTGSCEGQLSASGITSVYSCEDESFILTDFEPPEPLPASGTWVAVNDELMVLQDSCVRDGNEEIEFILPEYGEFSRISCSSSGNHCLLWSSGEGRILVLR